ncbi:MAG TPA: DNA-processing protein DprA [Bacteroidota bacterium]|jgi:DNA processing protein|nr:DNA-processing protein DprA [Bacteroidota bacterium]
MISVIDLLVLSQVPGIGANRLRNLVSHFNGTSQVFKASAREMAGVEGVSKRLASTLARSFRNGGLDFAKRYAEQQLSRLNRIDAHIITFWDDDYPGQLKRIYDPPPLLFMKGEIRESDVYAVAIVGTRSPSDYGTALAEKFSQEFARLGITVVSGLARGVDTVAHASTLKHHGRTVAVIGSGLDVMYPRENKPLSDRIAQHGAVLSECEMGAKPDAVNFPRRNRLISGLSLGTLVVETDIDGGAMITANMALDQNREVFAVPGNITSRRSHGCNVLIREGKAKLVENCDDILVELSTKLKPLLSGRPGQVQKPLPNLTLFEKNLHDVLSENALHIDAIAERANVSTADALVNLLSLEFKGLVRQLPGKMFLRA